MRSEDLDHLRALLEERSGFVLGADRNYLVEHRLGGLARREGFASVGVLLEALRTQPTHRLIWSAVEAMATTDTQFFRDRFPFLQLRDEVLPALGRLRAGRRVRAWSAGCSSGQEAYSIVMAADGAGVEVEVLGTDLSERALEKAQAGLYTQFEVQRGLPVRQLLRHFEKADEMWRAGPRLRAAVSWGRLNLLDDLEALGRFDVIFCRYLLSDLGAATRTRVLEAIARRLADDGCLFLGAGETVQGLTEAFRPVPGRRGLYVKNPDFARRVAA